MTQTIFQFAIEYQTTIWNDRTEVKIAKGQIAFLVALLLAHDQRGTLDDATADLSKRFDDNGKWRGAICLGLTNDGLIAEVGAVNSKRSSRKRGLLRRWRLVDAEKARHRVESLQKWIEAIENPQSGATDAGEKSSITHPISDKEN